MEIMNLEINILYFLCSPDTGQGASSRNGAITTDQLFAGFADIPAESLRQALRSMQADGLITMDRTGKRLAVTASGMHRLQSSVACQTYRFDGCRCDMAH